MSFVRLKTVNGAQYAYLVENTWTARGSRQKTTKYLGRSHHLAPTETVSYDILAADYRTLVQELLAKELEKRAFLKKEKEYCKDDIIVNLNRGSFTKKNKAIVIHSNEGFLSEHTYRALKHYCPQTERFEKELATLLLAAGIDIAPTLFVKVYEAAKRRAKKKD